MGWFDWIDITLILFNDKKNILVFYSTKVGKLWSVVYFYCNWQISAPPKNGSGREWESFFRELNGTEFSPNFFLWDWDGTRFFFVGVGRERFENQLPCHPWAPQQWLPTAPGVFTTVRVHLDGLNAEHKFWLWVTIRGVTRSRITRLKRDEISRRGEKLSRLELWCQHDGAWGWN